MLLDISDLLVDIAFYPAAERRVKLSQITDFHAKPGQQCNARHSGDESLISQIEAVIEVSVCETRCAFGKRPCPVAV